MEDAVLAQLLGMGFESSDIEACQRELSAQGTYSLQTATEWLLHYQQHDQTSPGRLVLTSPTVSTETKAVSSSSDLTSQSHDQPLKSRYVVSEEHGRDKDRFAAKEREEAIKKARMTRMADLKAKKQVRQQIEEDKKAREQKLKSPNATTSTSRSLQDATPPSQSGDSHVTKSHDTCRVQIRLPDGKALRHNFPPSATLGEVADYVRENAPQYSHVQLVQPFPHHEFTEEEHNSTLQSLNLCPSASLVVAKQLEISTAGPSTDSPPSETSDSTQAPPKAPTGFSLEQRHAASRHSSNYGTGARGQRSGGRGYRLGDGSGVREEPMEVDKDENEEPESEDEMDVLGLPAMGPPPPGRPHPLSMGAHRVVPNPILPGLVGSDDQRYRLGGKETVMMGDLQQQAHRMREAARSAAIQRSQASTPHTSHHLHTLSPPTLETLATRTLLSLSTSYGLPSCSAVSPLVAQKLITELKKDKKFNTKTLAAFHGCPLQVMELDNYILTTNELLQALRYFQSLTQLSLVSCSMVTDKAVTSLLPYLPGLTQLNLNACRQLGDAMCGVISRCSHLEVLKLSLSKVTDRGISLLLTTPLPSLRELDLSRTEVTVKCLEMLPTGLPNLESLNIEGTSIDNFIVLGQLPQLHTLNIAHCPMYSDVGSLANCRGLRNLSLGGLSVETKALQQLATGLQLESLNLPDRNTFFDDALKVISAFPLKSLNLMDYCHVTDEGVSHIGHMTSLQVLTLSRTKLTDQGMSFLTGLTNLHELNLDNTLITDAGMSCVSSLVQLDALSLSDTKVTSQFILDGVLDPLGSLSKLNLSRTFVCDQGISRLRLPSLSMLNVNWTCVTELSTLGALQESGCPVLEVLNNRNIGQPLPGQAVRDQRIDQ